MSKLAIELGRRIRAATAYASLSGTDSLASRIGVDPDTLRQVTTGVAPITDNDLASIIDAVSNATGMPPAFFTADLDQLRPGWEPPLSRLDRMETALNDHSSHAREILARADEIAERLERLERN